MPLSVIADADVPGLAAALARVATGGSFLNFLADPARVDDRVHARRTSVGCATVKRAYDPDDVFRLGAHVAPEPAGARRLRWEA